MPADQQCARCGIQALDGQAFEPADSFRRTRWYCPNCHAQHQRRVNATFLAIAAVFGAVGIVLKLVNPGWSSGNFLIGLFVLQLFATISIVPHELGHALTGRIFGLDVRGIIIGSGPTLFVIRMFGLPAEFKLVPAGGVALVQPKPVSWLRTKWFVMIAAGPMVHAIAIICAHFIFDIPLWPASVRHAGIGELFVLANWIPLAVSLAPFVTHTSHGPLPTDGLALLQLLFLRRLPFVPTQRTSRKSRVLAWIGALLLWSFAILCFVLAWFAITDTKATRQIRTFLGPLFAGMGAALLWLGWRALCHQPRRALVRYPQHAFLEEIHYHSKSCLRHPLASEYLSYVTNKNWAAAERALLKMCPPESNAYSAAAVGDCREAAGNYAGAAEMYALAETRLSPEAGVWPKLQRVKMLLRQDNVTAATELSRSILEPLNGAQKLAVLDSLACFPIMEGFKNFLAAADDFSREALEIQPQNLTIKGTRGSILVELGRIDEAEPLLNEVYTTSEADHDQRISAFYLGLIAKARGDIKRARTFAVQSLVCSENWLIERTQKELIS